MSPIPIFQHRLVYERFLPTFSGYLGVRQIHESGPHNKSEYDWIKKGKQFHVLGEDLPEDQEKTLLALTPEVCRFTAAIEDFYEKGYDEDGNLTGKNFEEFLREAVNQVLADRTWLTNCQCHFFRRLNFPFVDPKKVNFEDIQRLYEIVKKANQGAGLVDDLEDLYSQIIAEKAKIDAEHLQEYQDNDLTPPFEFNPPL